ncbi:MAG TPA: PilZ domain-containing protein [Kofleriaceae bacterium]|nr:PilZ domain-containing protein [Kofleriaceae bacterium]
MTDERRGSPRVAASIAGELEIDGGKSAIAITRDVGANGLLVFTRLRECTGSVKLTVVYKDEMLVLTGHVVRMEPVEDSQLWRNKVAIAIDGDHSAITKLFSAIAASDQTT